MLPKPVFEVPLWKVTSLFLQRKVGVDNFAKFMIDVMNKVINSSHHVSWIDSVLKVMMAYGSIRQNVRGKLS